MSMLLVSDVGYGYSTSLFEEVNLRIDRAEKVGIVGINGAGKSTLVKCLRGELEVTRGSITMQRGLKVAVLDQHTPEYLLGCGFKECVATAIPQDEMESRSWQISYLLDQLEVPEAIRERPMAQLSGGWQRFALLARAWLDEPQLWVLDEPTNFLDLEKMAMLERWIADAGRDTPMLIVSHDRRFLDNVTEQTLFLRSSNSRLYPHSYSRAVQLLTADDAAAESRREREQQQIDRLKRSAHHLRQIGNNKHSDTALKRSMQLSKRVEQLEKVSTPIHREAARDIRLANRGTHAQVLVTFENVVIASPRGDPLIHIPKLEIRQGERIAVLGRNGIGKSQLIERIHRAICDREEGKAGGISVTPSVTYGYLDQMLTQLPHGCSAANYVNSLFGFPLNRVTSLLVGAGFKLDTHDREIATLSAGQRVRLLLLVLRLTEPNFYLLDEPTNHVDIEGQEQLESEIIEHKATCVLVSHDREFTERVANRFIAVRNQRLVELESAASFYREIGIAT
ncbi:ABC transporter ATP-binding protein [Verminephrobacter aporrectodeae subsp. tuberculatae]|uniref:ATP-binding cassette domain-containing protein n=1 Tax=Verminephrobacter aporrectodeae TaxID=1110389 RepID=UPI002237947D|nr:ABC-F family ATP-binding cassette domain-containing protein [Verminephrobacter aporrectodeae]MCW5220387.1 ABC transporter ATP-binding protein [Verminephrobacter aporrectodeae subsp. tuberculatae]MCW5289683.1 ABC transporter ATP-binding protein [Verminephrobacter aporrectodeae subsp. tuberculatae]